ncbi:alpha/beta hydrolase family protein [Pontivivens ytuae]|uniref:Alpha/beta hydrolase family protein n=1 Tax=Pontivivens ytuae TaxID=2789856 RepID=A0A7S9LTK8_9RHOB|nr:hypothetical protein [Pontivivens ytuae]QPH55034.1 hypothetical protein I0K15_04595 [Pontivivens ytuae]
MSPVRLIVRGATALVLLLLGMMLYQERMLPVAVADVAATPGVFTEERLPRPMSFGRQGTTYVERDQGQRTFETDGVTWHMLDFGGSLTPRPAVVLFHGAGRTGLSQLDMWRAVARQHRLVLIAPDADGGWSIRQHGAGAVARILEAAGAEARIDSEQIFLFGHSAGGIHAQTLANGTDGPWQAVAVHAGTLPQRRIRAKEGAPDLLLILGTEDLNFPLDDGRASARALAEAGHDVLFRPVLGHDHWFYAIGPSIAATAWDWFAERG